MTESIAAGPLFITGIKLAGHPILGDLIINLPSDKKRNLIFTGKNGSGKTTLLNEMVKSAEWLSKFPSMLISDRYNNSCLTFNNDNDTSQIHHKEVILGAFKARREATLLEATSITKPQASVEPITKSVAPTFLTYLVNRRSQQAFAESDNDKAEAAKIKLWFEQLNVLFSKLFEQPLMLKFDRQNLNFTLVDDCSKEINLNKLSDGYSAVIEIITEIIMRMEAVHFADYEQQGIVFIDEIETHLHVSLQTQIMLFLTTFFPNVQFIVTTHSPFVLDAAQNSNIYDMETGDLRTQDEALK